jgi:hypothetical protein
VASSPVASRAVVSRAVAFRRELFHGELSREELRRQELPGGGLARGELRRGHVDSIVPIGEALARFRSKVGPPPAGLEGGAVSKEALVMRFLLALRRGDTATIRSLHLTRAEFAYLYYPHTRYTRPPYRQSPELLWLRMGMGSEKGVGRALRRLAGTDLAYRGVSCDSARKEGPNSIWEACVVLRGAGAHEERVRLFGGIIERQGRCKFLSYANDM